MVRGAAVVATVEVRGAVVGQVGCDGLLTVLAGNFHTKRNFHTLAGVSRLGSCRPCPVFPLLASVSGSRCLDAPIWSQ
eukprot:8980878-Pyramimonas_sp.AAC.1